MLLFIGLVILVNYRIEQLLNIVALFIDILWMYIFTNIIECTNSLLFEVFFWLYTLHF